MAVADPRSLRSSAFSLARRLPSSHAARIVMALAGPMPLYLSKSLMDSFPSVLRLLLQSPSTCFIRSTAVWCALPEPIKMASSSALDSHSAPSRSKRSRGRSSSAQSLMFSLPLLICRTSSRKPEIRPCRRHSVATML